MRVGNTRRVNLGQKSGAILMAATLLAAVGGPENARAAAATVGSTAARSHAVWMPPFTAATSDFINSLQGTTPITLNDADRTSLRLILSDPVLTGAFKDRLVGTDKFKASPTVEAALADTRADIAHAIVAGAEQIVKSVAAKGMSENALAASHKNMSSFAQTAGLATHPSVREAVSAVTIMDHLLRVDGMERASQEASKLLQMKAIESISESAASFSVLAQEDGAARHYYLDAPTMQGSKILWTGPGTLVLLPAGGKASASKRETSFGNIATLFLDLINRGRSYFTPDTHLPLLTGKTKAPDGFRGAPRLGFAVKILDFFIFAGAPGSGVPHNWFSSAREKSFEMFLDLLETLDNFVSSCKTATSKAGKSAATLIASTRQNVWPKRRPAEQRIHNFQATAKALKVDIQFKAVARIRSTIATYFKTAEIPSLLKDLKLISTDQNSRDQNSRNLFAGIVSQFPARPFADKQEMLTALGLREFKTAEDNQVKVDYDQKSGLIEVTHMVPAGYDFYNPDSLAKYGLPNRPLHDRPIQLPNGKGFAILHSARQEGFGGRTGTEVRKFYVFPNLPQFSSRNAIRAGLRQFVKDNFKRVINRLEEKESWNAKRSEYNQYLVEEGLIDKSNVLKKLGTDGLYFAPGNEPGTIMVLGRSEQDLNHDQVIALIQSKIGARNYELQNIERLQEARPRSESLSADPLIFSAEIKLKK